jgi:hypothetical protein
MFREPPQTFLRVVLSLTCRTSFSPRSLYVSAPDPPLLKFTVFPVGFSDKRKVTDGTPRVCPRCHNGRVSLLPLFDR